LIKKPPYVPDQNILYQKRLGSRQAIVQVMLKQMIPDEIITVI